MQRKYFTRDDDVTHMYDDVTHMYDDVTHMYDDVTHIRQREKVLYKRNVHMIQHIRQSREMYISYTI